MTRPNPINSTPATLPNAYSPSAFERIRNSIFSCALGHILNPLGGLLRFLIAGVPKSLMIDIRPFQATPAPHQEPAAQTTALSLEDYQSDSAPSERSRESSSASSTDERDKAYQVIQFQLAMQLSTN